MRYIIKATLAAALLCACQKGGEELPVPGSAAELSFNLSVDGTQVADTKTATRAAGADTDLKTYGFFLAGYHTEGLIDTKAATAIPNVFDKEIDDQQLPVPLVKFEGNKFTLKTIKWALDDLTYLSFFGWSQNKAFPTSVDASTTGIVGQTFNASDKGYPWLEVRNADAPADQTDVVGSRSIDHKNDAVLSAVDLDFRHLLSKLTFKAKSSSGATVTITAANIKYATDKVYKKARYTFGSEATEVGAWGSYAERQSGKVVLNSMPQTISGSSSATLGSMLLIPQALEAGAVSLELKYKISPNGTIDGQEQTKTLPLSAITPEQGKNYAYSIDIQATGITFMGNPIVEPWNLASTSTLLPIIHGPRDGKTLLLLDGYDKPYQHTDGKWYWLDRSGYNRHVELVGYTNGMYNAAGHYYTFGYGQSGRINSPLSTSPDAMTINMIHRLKSSGNGLIIKFASSDISGAVSPRPLWIEIAYGGANSFAVDAGSMGNRLSYSINASEFEKRTFWTSIVEASAGSTSLHKNGIEVGKRSIPQYVLGKLDNCYIATDANNIRADEVSYIKIVKKASSLATVMGDYKRVKDKYQVVPDAVETQIMPPVNDALKIWLDGYNAPKTIDGKLVWEDKGATKNHAQLMNNMVEWSSDGSYTFSPKSDGSDGGYMQLIKTLVETGVTVNNASPLTIEIVFIPNNSGNAKVPKAEGLLRLCEDINVYKSTIIVRSNYFASGWVCSNELGNNGRTRVPISNAQQDAGITHSLVWPMNSEAYFDGIKSSGSSGLRAGYTYCLIGYSMDQNSTNDMTKYFYSGKVKAIRIHNRTLTEAELLQNYQFDREYYGF